MKIRALLLVLTVVISGACGDGDEVEPAGSEGAVSATPPPGDSVTGIVTSVESSGLNEVSSFVVKTPDDEYYEILIDADLNDAFPLGHLEEHRVSADPVKVFFEVRDRKTYASWIEDA